MKRRMITGRYIDKNTLVLLHAEDFKDSINNQVVSYNNVTINNNGIFGKCFYCQGYVSISSNIVKSLYQKDFTVDFWFKVPSIPGGENTKIMLFGVNSAYWASAYGGIDLNVTRGYLHASLYNGSAIYMDDVIQISTNIWYHIAVVIKGNVFFLYVNGALVISKSFSGSLTPMNNTLDSMLGNGVSGYFPYYDKYIDEFRISNIARWTSSFTPPTKPY